MHEQAHTFFVSIWLHAMIVSPEAATRLGWTMLTLRGLYPITWALEGKFLGATTAANGLVVFAPADADCVGVFDAASDAFRCVDIASTLSSDWKFHGAATAANGLVIFAPFSADCVGVFNPTTNAFTCVDISYTISSD